MNPIRTIIFALILIFTISCDEEIAVDTVPAKFTVIKLRPDYIYLFNHETPPLVRLDPLMNDTIKVDVAVSYSEPQFGAISFFANEGWFYQPKSNFEGIDSITYTVCHGANCVSELIRMYVEPQIDPATCVWEMEGETVETKRNTSIEIRIFENDQACQSLGLSLSAPEKGRFETYQYSGNFRNIVYVYFPPSGFTGTDRFKYRLNTPDGFLEAECVITVK